MSRYLWVFAFALAGAALVSALLRLPPRAAVTPVRAPAAETTAVAVELNERGVVTTPATVAVGHVVSLAFVNRTPAPVRVALAGYEDRVAVAAIAPRATWRTVFAADRPGEQLAWVVNGQPRGRLDVTGSHLVEGHR